MKAAKIVFFILVACAQCGCRDQIIHNLSENDANRLVARLSDVSLRAEKVRQPDGKWALAVDRAESLAAMKFLNDSRLLREESQRTNEKPSILAGREDQRFRHERALSHEVEATLSGLPGVLEVRVHLNLPLLDPFFGQPLDKKLGSGSVLVVAGARFKAAKEEIAALVSGASGIPASEISVLVSAGGDKSPAKLVLAASAVSVEEPDTDRQPEQNAEASGGSARKNPMILPVERKASGIETHSSGEGGDAVSSKWLKRWPIGVADALRRFAPYAGVALISIGLVILAVVLLLKGKGQDEEVHSDLGWISGD